MVLFRNIEQLAFDMSPAADEMLFEVERIRTLILQLTESGKDFEGRPFAAYSTKPFYWRPGQGGENIAGEFRSRKDIQRLKRLAEVYGGGPTPQIDAYLNRRKASAKRTFKKLGAVDAGVRQTGLGIFFPGGYAQAKSSLGRTGVDLTGLDGAPHMMQAIKSFRRGDSAGLGIYGEEAERAEGHNEGIPGKLPRRRFFDVSDANLERMAAHLADRLVDRWIRGNTTA